MTGVSLDLTDQPSRSAIGALEPRHRKMRELECGHQDDGTIMIGASPSSVHSCGL
jgi:hypothetical protein